MIVFALAGLSTITSCLPAAEGVLKLEVFFDVFFFEEVFFLVVAFLVTAFDAVLAVFFFVVDFLVVFFLAMGRCFDDRRPGRSGSPLRGVFGGRTEVAVASRPMRIRPAGGAALKD